MRHKSEALSCLRAVLENKRLLLLDEVLVGNKADLYACGQDVVFSRDQLLSVLAVGRIVARRSGAPRGSASLRLRVSADAVGIEKRLCRRFRAVSIRFVGGFD